MSKKETPEFNQKEITDLFFKWFFDRNPQSEIPQEVLHYKSPITQNVVLTMFSKYPDAFIHLNKHFNSFNCYKLDKKDLFHYAKQLGQKFQVKQNQMYWLTNWKRKDDFTSEMIKKAPYLKKDDIRLIKSKIDQPGMESAKSRVESSLGLQGKLKKEKMTKEDKKNMIMKEEPKTSGVIPIEAVKKNLILSIKNKECCKSCSLIDKDYTTMDWINVDKVEPIDILWCGEAPGADEIEGDKKPFVGRAGQTLRRQIESYGLSDLKSIIFNTVLCRPDNNVLTPHKDAIDNCSEFLEKMITAFKPKLIVALGATAMSRFGIEGQITKSRGIHKYKGIDVLVTFHPSYILRNQGQAEWNEDFGVIKNKLVSEQKEETIKYANEHKMLKVDSSEQMWPEFSTVNGDVLKELRRKDIYLIDVQQLYNKDKAVYIYRDMKTKKKHILMDNTYTYFYVAKDDQVNPKHVLPFDQVRRVDCDSYYRLKDTLPVFPVNYESDVSVPDKRSQAYYSVKREIEEPYNLSFVVVDIECPTVDNTFPNPKEAPAAINCIGVYYSETQQNLTLVLNPPGKKNQDTEDTKYYDDEKSLLQAFNNVLGNINPDIITGWNVLFDIETIINRMYQVGLDPNTLSIVKGAKVDCDGENYRCSIPGFIVIDYMYLYKSVYGKAQESYSLNNISKVELGMTKVQYEGSLYDLYINDLPKYIEYNKMDCELVYFIDKGFINEQGKKKGGLGYIDLSNELRRVTGTTWDSCLRSSGLCDGLVCQYLHEKKMVVASRNSIHRGVKKSLVGAYVKEPNSGLYDWVIDFDAASLYPSIMISYNLGTETYFSKIDENEAKTYLYDRENFMLKDNLDIIYDPLYSARMEKIDPKKFCDMIENEKLCISITGDMYKRPDSETGVSMLSQIVTDLIKQRKVYKKKMLEAESKGNKNEKQFYHNKQWSYKILANSLYGFLTFEGSRMYIYPIASTITNSGQELVKCTAYMVNEFMKQKEKK